MAELTAMSYVWLNLLVTFSHCSTFFMKVVLGEKISQ